MKDEAKTPFVLTCGREGKTFAIKQMADVMETAFEQHFDCTPEDPSGYESALMEEYGWSREGDPTTDVIAMSAEIEGAPAGIFNQ